MKKIFLISIISIIGAINGYGQDIHFSQFQQTPLLINPALTGVFNGDVRALINYKNQWSSIATPYKTFALSYDMALFKNEWKNGFLGAGFYFIRDKAGEFDMGITQLNVSVSGIVPITKNNIVSVGLQGGFSQRSIDASKLKWGSQFDGTKYDPTIDPGESSDFNSFGFGDITAGVLWSYGKSKTSVASDLEFKARAGVAFFHVNKPKWKFYSFSDEKLYSKIVVHGSTYIGLKNTNFALLPSGVFFKQGPSKQLNVGMMIRYMLKPQSKYTGFIKESALLFGGHYRIGDAFIPSMMYEMANYAIGISYDVNISSLKTGSNGKGGIEIVLRYINPNPFQYGRGTKGTPML